ncbi:MAG: molybdate ABC transporter permease subunit [Eggerthella sp.]|nr:molybdate ABC transporter permease subunit [Eggerthella sp.]
MNAKRCIMHTTCLFMLILGLMTALLPCKAYADEALGDVDTPQTPKTTNSQTPSPENEESAKVSVSEDATSAAIEGSSYAICDFSHAQKGSNRAIDGTYYGYSYLVGNKAGEFFQLIASESYAVAYVPAQAAQTLGIDIDDENDKALLKNYFCALDGETAAGSIPLSRISTWYFTSNPTYEMGNIRFAFDHEINGNVYASVIGIDGSDLTDSDNPNYFKPSFADFGRLAPANEVTVNEGATGIAAAGKFLSELDWSPLWVTLKTTGVAIVFIFILGLLAAYWCLHLSQKAKNIADSIFTIPMVLPPTVCGFILLYLCGRNTAFGSFFIDIGFPLIFSWPATVIAAVVVAFPLMYRSALGAFENLDTNMLDAARTLGWSNTRIFLKLMLPLSWSSIAAGTVLAFARALGEFGATLFLAGNYLGITRTIPIAIYFEWMNGNDGVAWFWTAIVIGFSFIVILFINLWSNRTTKYRKGAKQ